MWWRAGVAAYALCQVTAADPVAGRLQPVAGSSCSGAVVHATLAVCNAGSLQSWPQTISATSARISVDAIHSHLYDCAALYIVVIASSILALLVRTAGEHQIVLLCK